MGNTKGNTKGNTAKGKGKGNAAPTITFTKPTPVAPVNRKGTSTLERGTVTGTGWALMGNLTLQAGTLPANRELVAVQVAAGITYYTARTQANRYAQWYKGNPNITPPRGVVLPGTWGPQG